MRIWLKIEFKSLCELYLQKLRLPCVPLAKRESISQFDIPCSMFNILSVIPAAAHLRITFPLDISG